MIIFINIIIILSLVLVAFKLLLSEALLQKTISLYFLFSGLIILILNNQNVGMVPIIDIVFLLVLLELLVVLFLLQIIRVVK